MLIIFSNCKSSFTDDLGCCDDKLNDISDLATALVEATCTATASYC